MAAMACGKRTPRPGPDAGATPARTSAAQSSDAAVVASAPPDAALADAAPPLSAAGGPRLAALGFALTQTYREPRFEWRRWQELYWQGVADSLPALPPEPAADGKGCTAGMLRVKGSFVLDTSKRDDTDAVAGYQNETCTFWRTADHGENGLCDRFDAAKWRVKLEGLPRKQLDFCIDRYEYPNAYAEFPLVVVTFAEAVAFCKKEQKRLCDENEWTFACEGEEALPYPYGFERDSAKCNISVLGPGPTKDMFSPRTTGDTAKGIDLSWRGKRSGEMRACASPFGVMDMTGNIDEWTLNARKYGRKMIMKGGHWGPARQRCRPATRGHGPFYVRYDQGFRCCTDAPG
ncbi:MAG: SUMF1/EgtB/PvdO family nonheme iron enzyme [Myxococcales bacterium]|nr:SUMF1/EgtB/PvdO family nonheme iron enzyme [Myxococcales bacterium]